MADRMQRDQEHQRVLDELWPCWSCHEEDQNQEYREGEEGGDPVSVGHVLPRCQQLAHESGESSTVSLPRHRDQRPGCEVGRMGKRIEG